MTKKAPSNSPQKLSPLPPHPHKKVLCIICSVCSDSADRNQNVQSVDSKLLTSPDTVWNQNLLSKLHIKAEYCC